MNKTNLAAYNNGWYQTKASVIKRIIWLYVSAIFFKTTWLPVNGLKCSLLRLFGANIGKGVTVKPGVNIKYPWLLTIGNYSWIGENVWIDNLVEVTIGNHVCLSQGCMLLTGNHNFTTSTFDLMVGNIILEDGVWIGAKGTVCPGVTCKSHAVLTVNSVATQNLQAYGIYRGNPCVWVKERVII